MCSFGTLNVPCAILEKEKDGEKDKKKEKKIFLHLSISLNCSSNIERMQ